MNPDDEGCPVCLLRTGTGDAALEMLPEAVVAPRPRGRKIRPLRLALLVIVLVAALGTGYLGLGMASGSDPLMGWRASGSKPAAPQPSGVGQGSAAGQQIGAQGPGEIRGGGAAPAPEATAVPQPSPTTAPPTPEPTAIGAELRFIPPLPKTRLTPEDLAGRWTGYATVRRISLLGGSAQDQELVREIQREARFEPRPLTVVIVASSPESGTATMATGKPDALKPGDDPPGPILQLELDGATASYSYRDGALSFPVEPDGHFDGQAGYQEGRFLIEGVWRMLKPLRPGDASSPMQLWEGTWTVAKSPSEG